MLSIISTVGTTVFGAYGTPLNTAVKQFEQSQPKDIRRIIDGRSFPGEEIYQQALADLKAKAGSFLRKACAEINAIEGFHTKHGVALGNHYHFLASQTATGILAARVLRDFCLERYQASHADVRLVQGLQVQDERKFRLEGLPFLIQVIYEVINDAQKKRLTVVLNPTGGFKAAIPYITLVGMIRHVEVGLIHETSEELITLAGLPITLDLDEISTISAVLEECEQEQQEGMRQAKLANDLGLAPNELIESHPLWSLFEQLNSERYILSGLGTIALEELRARMKQPRVFLSKQAAERYDQLDKVQQEKFNRYFSRLREPGWIEQKRHDEFKNPGGATAIKPGKVDERLFIYELDDGAILVAELAFHLPNNSYDRVPQHRKDYDVYRLWEDHL